MKITVEISDTFIEEEELTDAIKGSIIQEVTYAVKAMVKEQVENEIAKAVRDSIKDTIEKASDETISEFLETGIIKIGNTEVLAKDHLRQIFQTSTSWSNPSKQVESLAKKWAEELKAKYDGAFVTHLVQRINIAGMLKPEVATLLLADAPK